MIKIRYKFLEYEQNNFHRVKSVQIRIFFWSVFSRIRTEYGPENTPYLDNFQVVFVAKKKQPWVYHSYIKFIVFQYFLLTKQTTPNFLNQYFNVL